MSYEIPKNLKYEEKFFFNLSLSQAGWIGLFGTIGATIFLKTPFPFEVKAALGLVFLGLGGGFAFFNLREHLTTFGNYFLRPRELGYLSKQMESFIEVSRIADSTAYLSNGSAKAILQVQPLNFHILDIKHQQAIISAYKDFLNSLDFPIQIVMRTVNLSLEEYLKTLELKVKKSKNEKIHKQFVDFKEFVTTFIDNHAVKNRLFYIIIPAEEKNPKYILSQLDIRVTLCQEKLKACNLITKRLNTNELVSMLSSYFEGFIENGTGYLSMLSILEKQKGVKQCS
ncbi:MAG: hypothetical protein WC652_07055 [archaeon]|jgi:hypothetical protein